MTAPNDQNRRARELHARTGWSYPECHRVLRLLLTPDAIDALIKLRGVAPPRGPVFDGTPRIVSRGRLVVIDVAERGGR